LNGIEEIPIPNITFVEVLMRAARDNAAVILAVLFCLKACRLALCHGVSSPALWRVILAFIARSPTTKTGLRRIK